MDEVTKADARNYLSAAGFFLLSAYFILGIINNVVGIGSSENSFYLHLILGLSLLVVSTLLIVIKKRDFLAILFFMFGFFELFITFSSVLLWNTVIIGFMLLMSIIFLTSKDKVKWLIFIIPLILFLYSIYALCMPVTTTGFCIFFGVLAVITVYFTFACCFEKIHLPGYKLLTTEETTIFSNSGAVLGYVLFAMVSGGYALHYFFGEALLPLDAMKVIAPLCAALLIYVSILMLTVGKMRYTSVMFMLMGTLLAIAIFSPGYMLIGIGILWIVLGLYAILRKENRILAGIMLIIYGCTDFITELSDGVLPNLPMLSGILNLIPCLMAIILSFVVFTYKPKTDA